MIYDESLLSIILDMLPKKLEPTMEDAMLAEYKTVLGGNMFVYKRVSYCPSMDGEISWPPLQGDDKYRWAAECHCTACGSKWYSGWISGGGLLMPYIEDGEYCIGVSDWEDENVVMVNEGDDILCPFCDENITATPKSKLRHGRTYQIMVCEPRSVEFNGLKHTLLMYWMLRRELNERGVTYEESYPAFAVLLDEYKDITIFSHCKKRWLRKKDSRRRVEGGTQRS